MNSKWHKKTSVNGDITCSRKPRWIVMAALAGSLALPAELMAAQNALKSLSFNQLPGNLIELRLKMEGPAEKPSGFTIDNPARIALDFADTRNDLAKRVIPVDSGNVRSINAVEFQGRTRLIVNLNELTPYSTTVDGEDILIRLASGGNAAPVEAASSPVATVVNAAAITSTRSLRDMHFRRSDDGAGRITFKLTDPNTPIDIKQIGQKVVIDMRGVDVDDSMLKRLDVMDFATPVQFIDTYRRGDNVRIEIRPSRGADYEQIAYQSDNHFTLELRPLAEEEVQARKERTFEGERLSLNFQDIQVRSVLQLLADFTDQNVVVSDSVDGDVTLRLKNVPWDQALDIILKSKGLAMRQNGNVLMVAPADEIAAREQLELESAQKVHKLSKLRTEMIQINYAKAENIAGVLRAGQSGGGEGDSESANEGLLSDRGSASIDERTNTVLVTDTNESLEKIHELIAKLDVPVRQVLIESRVVIATDDFNEEMGMRVGLTRYPDNNIAGGYGITSGNLNAVTNVYNQSIAGQSDEEVEAPDRWNVNLPASNPAGSIGFNFGTLPLGAYLELELSAMEAEGRGEVVSSPRVITANQHEAHIEQGVEIPYLEASSSGAATVSFKKAVLALNVIPQITPDDRIIMDLTVNKDSVGEWYGAGESQVPTVDTREVSTQVLVDNGETVVLGGIYEQVRTNSTRKVPFLGDLPILGRLFRTDLSKDEKNELLIFVTPKIIGDSTASR